MRYLNAIAAHEKFIARGTYHRYAGDDLTNYTEAWTRHDVGGGAILTRIDQDARFTEGWSRLVEVLSNPDGGIERVKIQTNHSLADAPFRMMKTDYSFLDGYVQIGRTVDGETDYAEINLPPDTFIRLIDFAFFWGMALRRAEADNADQFPVFIPFHKPIGAPGQVVVGKLPTVESVQTESLTINGRDRQLTRYVTLGKRVIWLDNHDVPIKINHAANRLSDVLSDYAHR